MTHIAVDNGSGVEQEERKGHKASPLQKAFSETNRSSVSNLPTHGISPLRDVCKFVSLRCHDQDPFGEANQTQESHEKHQVDGEVESEVLRGDLDEPRHLRLQALKVMGHDLLSLFRPLQHRDHGKVDEGEQEKSPYTSGLIAVVVLKES